MHDCHCITFDTIDLIFDTVDLPVLAIELSSVLQSEVEKFLSCTSSGMPPVAFSRTTRSSRRSLRGHVNASAPLYWVRGPSLFRVNILGIWTVFRRTCVEVLAIISVPQMFEL